MYDSLEVKRVKTVLYYENNKVMYEGDTKKNTFGHDLYHGFGTVYDREGRVMYSGEWLEHAKHGDGEMYVAGKLQFKGTFVKGKKEGFGRTYFEDGSVQYEGHFVNDQYSGEGTVYYPAEFLQQYAAVRQQYAYEERPFYSGYFLQGMKKGQGTQYYPTGAKQYEGEFLWNELSGSAKEYFDVSEAQPDALKFDGSFFDSKKHGKGQLYNAAGELVYDGAFREDIQTGIGELYSQGQLVYKGDFLDGQRHGRGEAYNDEGKVIYSGEFVHDERMRITPEVERQIADLQQQLEALVGLPNAKRELRHLINFIKIQGMRVDYGLASVQMTYHLVFTGNPGTGKTTVARIIGRIYKLLGVLSSGHFVETDRAGLVAGYVGQTALKVQEVVKKATGGVLFIDEAYALVQEEKDVFGKEAIDSLLKAMEDLRDDLVIIVAGYEDLMERFLQSNPGFKSRFNHFVAFENFTTDELFSIFEQLCTKHDYTYDTHFAAAMFEQLQALPIAQLPNFSNGRYIRNIFEKLATLQANRLAEATHVTRIDLQTFTMADFTVGIQHDLFEKTF